MIEDPRTRFGDHGAEKVPEMQISHLGLAMGIAKAFSIAHWMDRREAWCPKSY